MENTLEKVPGFRDVEIEKKMNDLEKKIDKILEVLLEIKNA